MVILASATLVETMTLRVRGGAGSKTAICNSVERPECSANGSSSGAPLGSLRREVRRVEGGRNEDEPMNVVGELLQAAVNLLSSSQEHENIPSRLLQSYSFSTRSARRSTRADLEMNVEDGLDRSLHHICRRLLQIRNLNRVRSPLQENLFSEKTSESNIALSVEDI